MPPVERKLAAILHADVVGYSRLMADDEAATIRTIAAYRTETENLVAEHCGRVVDNPGDEFLAEFPTALDAVEAAVEIQRVLGARNAGLPEARRMQFRIGIHMGDVSTDGERIYGDGVNIAARLQGLAEPGGLCISSTVREQVRSKLELTYDDLGDQEVKNIPDPVRVYRVRLDTDKATPTTERRRDPRAILAAGLLIVLAVGAWWLWSTYAGRGPEAMPGEEAFTVPGFGGAPAIAVLRFCNLSGDPEQEYFADGIAEDLITRLSRFRSFPVIARNSTFTFNGCSADVKQVSGELEARYIVEWSVVSLRPEMMSTGNVDKLSDYPNTVTRFANTPFNNGGNVELRADGRDVRVRAFESESRSASNHPQSPNLRESIDQFLGDPIRKVFLIRFGTHVDKGEDSNGRSALSNRNYSIGHGFSRIAPPGAVHTHRLGDVLDLLIPQIVVGEFELASDLFPHRARYTQATRLGQALQSRSDVHAVSVDPLPIRGHISHVDPDTELHPASFGKSGIAGREDALDLHSCLHSIEGGGKLGQELVSGIVHDPATMLRDQHADLIAIRSKDANGGRLIVRHQPAVALHIGVEDRSELAFDGRHHDAPG